jgi:hypothetical protein
VFPYPYGFRLSTHPAYQLQPVAWHIIRLPGFAQTSFIRASHFKAKLHVRPEFSASVLLVMKHFKTQNVAIYSRVD